MTGQGGIIRYTWTPERIAALALLSADGSTDAQVAQILNTSRSAIVGARWRFGITAANPDYPHRCIPKDFAQLGPTLSVNQAAAHYKASPTTIRNWLKRLDLKPARIAREPRAKVAPVPKPAPKVTFTPSYRAPRRTTGKNAYLRYNVPERDASVASSAQLYLQRYAPVIRASTLDETAPRDLWIVHGRRMSETDMIAAATRKGWGAAA